MAIDGTEYYALEFKGCRAQDQAELNFLCALSDSESTNAYLEALALETARLQGISLYKYVYGDRIGKTFKQIKDEYANKIRKLADDIIREHGCDNV